MENKQRERKKDGFRDERYFVIPTEAFRNYAAHPLVRTMYPTDVGFFPQARGHYRERTEGISENILIYCVGGSGTILVETKKYVLHEGEAFCIPAGKRHLYYADEREPWSIFWVHFKGEQARHFPLEECAVAALPYRQAQNRLTELFELLFQVLERNYTLGNCIYSSQVLLLILSEIYFREKEDGESRQNRQLTEMVRYMYAHLTKELTLDELSAESGLSKSYIHAIFRKYAGRPPIDFFLRLKMREACRLLKSTELYVAEIGQRLGYDDPYYFSRIFKKVTGVSPKEYRNGDYPPKQ